MAIDASVILATVNVVLWPLVMTLMNAGFKLVYVKGVDVLMHQEALNVFVPLDLMSLLMVDSASVSIFIFGERFTCTKTSSFSVNLIVGNNRFAKRNYLENSVGLFLLKPRMAA